VSIFSNDNFLIGVHQSILLRFGIRKDTVITQRLFDELREAESEKEIEEYLLNLLSRRMHARSELKMKAQRKGYPAVKIDHVLHIFEEKGWIDDTGFAISFARDKFELQRWGPVKIRSKLRSLGISRTDIEHALRKIETSEDDFEILRQLVLKRKAYFLREPNLQKRKRKIADYLLRKGFSSDNVFKYLEQFLTMIEQ